MPERRHRTLSAVALPALVGQEAWRAQLEQLCQPEGARVLIWAGPGLGKTRHAQELATRWRAQGRPVALVSWGLTHAQVNAQVNAQAAIAAALHEAGLGGDPDQGLAQLVKRRGALVLDGVEGDLDEVQALIMELDARYPTLTLLVTSRRRLSLRGVSTLELEPLSLPEAMQLFEACARQQRPGWRCSHAQRGELSALCDALGGVPQAIELAASHAHVLTLEQLSARYAAAQGPAQGPLQEAVATSWQLLPEQAQRALSCLSSLSGSFTFEAAQALLLGGDEPLEAEDALELVSTLCEHGLVRAFNPQGAPEQLRLAMLPAVRSFAAGRLGPRAQALAERAHADYFGGLVERAGQDEQAWLGLGLELEDLQVAYERFASRDPARAERVASGLVGLLGRWGAQGLMQQMTARSVELAASAPSQAHMIGQRALSRAARGQRREALDDLALALALLEQGQAPALRASLLLGLAQQLMAAGRPEEALSALSKAADQAEQAQERACVLEVAWQRALAMQALQRPEDATSALEQLVDQATRHGDEVYRAMALARLGPLHLDAGRLNEARRALFEALHLCELSAPLARQKPLIHEQLGALCAAADDPQGALTHLDLAVEAAANPWGSRTMGRLMVERASWLMVCGQAALASAACEQLIAHHQDAATRQRAQALLAALAMGQGDWSLASHSAALALRGEPGLEAAARSLALACQGVAASALGQPTRMHTALAALEALDPLRAQQAWLLISPDMAQAQALRGVDEAAWRQGLRAFLDHQAKAGVGAGRQDALGRAWGQSALTLARQVQAQLSQAQLAVQADTPLVPSQAVPGAWVVCPEGSRFLSPQGQLLHIHRPLLLRLMQHLVALRLEHPGRSIDPDGLFQVGWPGERATAKSARNRLYAAVHTLRQDGFAGLLITSPDGGYLLDPLCPLVRQA